MKRIVLHYAAKPLCLLMIFSFVLVDMNLRTVQAGIISTETIVTVQQNEEAREQVGAFLAREEVQQIMLSHGIAPDEVQLRVAGLSDMEIQRIAAQLDTLPAGAGAGVGAVIGAVVFIFVVLLLTDILGLTKVFPFTKSIR